MSFSRQRSLGFTLIELLIVISLVAILIALSAPSFVEMIKTQRLRGVHAQLLTDLHFARSEAVRLRTPVHVAVSASSATTKACYVIFSDSITARPFSASCDCTQPSGSRCSAATTAELRTVVMDEWAGIDLVPVQDARAAVDPFSGTIIVTKNDVGATVGTPLEVNVSYDSEHLLKAFMDLGGVVRGCAPSASRVKAVAC